MKKKWLPWVIAVGAVVVVIGTLLIWNPPFVQNILGGGDSSTTASSETDKKIIARVGPAKLTMTDYQRLVAMYAQMSGGAVPEPTDIINEWIEQEIVYQQAKKMNLEKNDTVKMALDQLKFTYELSKKQLYTQAWAQEEAKKIQVSPQELQAYFDKHKEEFLYEVKFAQIMVEDPMMANQIYQQLQTGTSFKKLAEQYSLDQMKGESSTFLPRGSGLLTLPMEDAIFALKPGQFTQPIMTSQGLTFIFKLEDKVKVKKDVSYSEVAGYLESMLLYQKAEQAINVKLDSLRTAAQSEIEINLETLLY